MAIGFPARFVESRTYPFQQDELAAVVRSALENLGWSYKVPAGWEFLASVPFSGWTWGEEFKVRILQGGVIEAESKCISGRMPQVFDFGKNRKNIETFFGLVEHGIRQGVHERPVSATMRETAGQGRQSPIQNNRAATLFGGCLITTLVLGALIYFISAVIGLLTGNLYLPGRGHSETIHGTLARIISVIILAVFAWVLVRVFRRASRNSFKPPQ